MGSQIIIRMLLSEHVIRWPSKAVSVCVPQGLIPGLLSSLCSSWASSSSVALPRLLMTSRTTPSSLLPPDCWASACVGLRVKLKSKLSFLALFVLLAPGFCEFPSDEALCVVSQDSRGSSALYSTSFSFSLCWVSIAVRGFSLQGLLWLQSWALGHVVSSSCNRRALERRLRSCGTWA